MTATLFVLIHPRRTERTYSSPRAPVQAEETIHARWTVPRGIIAAYILGGLLNLILLLTYLACLNLDHY